jgi:asparagine synthase (glutamine-hydrolysing)
VCGIASIVCPEPMPELADLGRRMLQAVAHRGPDGERLECFDGGRRVGPGAPASIVLGGRRLAIQDRSELGAQPMTDPSGRYVIAYNGEVYNFVELREAMERQGERFASGSDTEVLLRLLVHEGAAALPRLDGMFAFLFLDLRRLRLLAARDRFGIKPLYRWRSRDGRLAFASEIKQFTVLPGFTAALNAPRGWDYLSRGLIDHTSETLFAGVTQVPAGELVEVRLDTAAPSARSRRWYELKPTAPPADETTWPRTLADELGGSVRRRLRADVTVGSCLSGGLDSSSIVCLVAEARKEGGLNGEQTVFTARPAGAEDDEWPWAREVAGHAGARPVQVPVEGGELLERLPELVWLQDEPFASGSIFAQFKVFEAAAAHGVTVMLDGQGADESLGGYHVYFGVYLAQLLRSRRLTEALRQARAVCRAHRVSPWWLVRGIIASWLPVPELLGRLTRRAVSRVVDADRLGVPPADPFRTMSGRRNGVRAFSIDQLTAASLPMLLHWEDRSSMAHGVEARVPFLAHRFVELVLGLPPEARIRGAVTKAVLRDAMHGRVPRRVLDRLDKVAFSTPEARWLCRDHRDAAGRALERALDAAGPVLARNAAEVLRGMAGGARPYDPVLWRVLCFGAWLDRFAVSVP